MLKPCPDPTQNPDDCPQCHGWGFKCSTFVRSHPASQVALGRALYQIGYDPTRLYGSVAECVEGERRTAEDRKR